MGQFTIEYLEKQPAMWLEKIKTDKTDKDKEIALSLSKTATDRIVIAKKLLCLVKEKGFTIDKCGHDFPRWEKDESEEFICQLVEEMWVGYKVSEEISKNNEIIELGTYRMDCYKCSKGYHTAMLDLKEKRIYLVKKDWKMNFKDGKYVGKENETIDRSRCQFENGFPSIVVEINVPSGKMLMANVLHKWYDWTKAKPENEKLKHTHEYDINYLIGQKNMSEMQSTLNCAELHIGNCACDMYQTTPNKDRFVVGSFELINRKGYKQVGDVCTDYWGYYIVDKDDFIAKAGKDELINEGIDRGMKSWELKSSDRDIYEIDCVPGRYRFTHKYHILEDRDAGTSTYTTIKRVGDVK